MARVAAVVLAGGAGRRLGGSDKPALQIGGRSMLDRVLHAVSGSTPCVVVGPVSAVPQGVLTTVEDPPGGGPVAATAAGLALVGDSADYVGLFAADLPFLSRLAVSLLHVDVQFSKKDGVVLVDGDGRRQLLCGMWQVAKLREAIDRLAAERGLAGASMRALVDGLTVHESPWKEPGPPPWFDCDTAEDLRQAEEWAAREGAGEMTLDEWTAAACAELDLDEADVETKIVLDLARDVAHNVLRPAAPVTAYLLGLAVGRGADPVEAAARLTALAAPGG